MRSTTLCLALFSAAAVRAQPAAPADSAALTLENLITQVESAWPGVMKYSDRIAALEVLAEGAKAWMPPVFSAGADRFPYSMKGLNEMSPMNQAGLMFSLSQMVPNPSKLKLKSHYLRSLTDVQRQEVEWTKNELRALARKFYYRRFVSEQKLRVIEESASVLALLIATAESRYAYNQAMLPDIYKAKAKLEEIRNMRLMEESAVAESNIGINTLLNRDIGTPFSIDKNIVLRDYGPTPDTAVRSDIEAMKSMIASMQAEQKYMGSQARPDFGMQVQHMQMFGMPERFSVMGMVTIPIVPWSARMYRSDVKAMEMEIEAARKEIEAMQIMARRMAAETLTMLNYTKQQLINYDTALVPAFEKNLEANLLAFRQNTAGFFVLLDAWEMLLMKKMERLALLHRAFELQTTYEYETEVR